MGSGKGHNKRLRQITAIKNKSALDLIQNHGFKPEYNNASKILSEKTLIPTITALLGEIESKGINLILSNSYGKSNTLGSTISYADGHTSTFEKGISNNYFHCDCGKNNHDNICFHRLAHATYQFMLDGESYESEVPLLDSLHELQLSENLESYDKLINDTSELLRNYITQKPALLNKYLKSIRNSDNKPPDVSALLVRKNAYQGEAKTVDYGDFVNKVREEDKGISLTEILAPIDPQNKAKGSMFIDKNKKYLGFNKVVSGGLANLFSTKTIISYQEKEDGQGFFVIKTKDKSVVSFYDPEEKKLNIISNIKDKEEQEDMEKFSAMMYPMFARIYNEGKSKGQYKPYTEELREAIGKYNAKDNTINGTAKENMMGVGRITGLAQRAAENYPIETLSLNSSPIFINNWINSTYEHIDLSKPDKEKDNDLYF